MAKVESYNKRGTIAQDDKELFVIRKDFSGGQNNRVHGSNIADTQATVLTNVDISVPAQRTKRRGLTLIDTLDSNPGTGLYGFQPDGGTNLLVETDGQKLRTWNQSGAFTTRKSDYTNNLLTTILKVGELGLNDVFVAGNGTNNWFRYDPADLNNPQDLGNMNTSPFLSSVGLYYGNRMWVLYKNQLGWSDAFPADYSVAFDRTTNYYRIPVGTSMALIGIRSLGIVVMGQDQIWGVTPSTTPAATDIPEKILDIGCEAGNTACQVGDDIYFLASDGVRGVFRTQQDKIQLGSSYPVSYALKTEVDSLNWAQISKACSVYFNNMYLISVPVNASSYNNQVWIYYPATQGWTVISGWNVSAWTTLTVSGKQQLYATDSTTGKVYQVLSGFSDNGVAIDYVEEGRKEDMGQPLVKKVGGTLKIKALSSGNYNLSVSVSVDDQDYTLLGVMNIAGNAPTLPINLPFNLSDTNLIEEPFSLDSLGEWYQMRVKIEHNALNGSDDITVYQYSITTFANEYQSE